MRRTVVLCLLAASAALGQDPCKLEFENEWVRVSRVSYAPFGKSKTHDHPAYPTVYVYTTDGGPIRFRHNDGIEVDRGEVKAGGIRFNRGMAERHEVESLSDIPSEYLRIELKTEPLELPARDIRIPPTENRGFENAQVRIEKLTCAAHQKCGISELASVIVNLEDRNPTWIHKESPVFENTTDQPLKLIRVALKSAPRGLQASSSKTGRP